MKPPLTDRSTHSTVPRTPNAGPLLTRTGHRPLRPSPLGERPFRHVDAA
ncbi:hypothetical protein Q8791_20385 [Nocardiopsis sp. CT-R113]|uniref:Uncharacterized protein n=1 Tax=Nocardiopsis codii TaxID=3065942 RepID=A0ABU7KCD5_9ACTN|nr:hypothetical protein [Nocardiopsis sp. CT-R113]MEE2039584.1 hypothetical protein [Nocardiopsis sp. CT-R113]